jgi:hypothetical protein
MPEGAGRGHLNISKFQVVLFPDDFEPAGSVKKSESGGGKVRQKWKSLRNIEAFSGLIVYI